MPSFPFGEKEKKEKKKYCGNCGTELMESIEDDGIKLIECYYHGLNFSPVCDTTYGCENK